MKQLLSFIFVVITNVLEICYHFGSKQQEKEPLFEWTGQHMGTGGRYPNRLLNYSESIPEGYTLEHMQLIFRHGTRYPVVKATQAINNSLELLQQSTNQSLVSWVKNYENSFLQSRIGLLTSWGQEELYELGRNIAVSYPDFLDHLVVGKDVVQFTAYSSWSERSSQSGSAFCIGLFEGKGNLAGSSRLLGVPIMTFPKYEDPLITPHKSCARWQREVGDTDIVDQHVKPFEVKYLEPIANRLSNDLALNITTKNITNFFTGCVSEIAVHQRQNTFCSLFTKDDILALEFIDDLKHYYKYSYGLPINRKISCALGKNIMENMERYLSEKSVPPLDVKFGHTETTLPLRTLLGLYEQDFDIEMSLKEIEDRQFKMSHFGTFANNIAFQILSDKQQNKYVRVLDNQQAILIPGCESQICTMNQFRQVMDTRLQCDFKQLCL